MQVLEPRMSISKTASLVADTLVAPKEAVKYVDSGATRAVAIFAALAPIAIIVQLGNSRLVSTNLLSMLDETQRAHVAVSLRWGTLLTLVVATFVLLIKAWITAYLTWATSLFVGANAPFSKIFPPGAR